MAVWSPLLTASMSDGCVPAIKGTTVRETRTTQFFMVQTSDSGQRVDVQFAGAAAHLLDRIVHLVHQGQQEIGLRRPGGVFEVASALNLSGAAADDHLRQILARVRVAVREARSVEDRDVVEQCPTAVLCSGELVEVFREQKGGVGVCL